MVIRRFASVIILLLALISRASAYGPSGNGGAPPNGAGSLGDVTAGGPNGTLSQFSLNSQFNIKAPQFGASGSRVTMTCTATASSSNLTNCGSCLDQNGNSTTCDFKANQFVRVAAAGIDTSGNGMTAESAPSAPTVTCSTSGHGAGSSCSAYSIASAGTCNQVTNPTILTLTNTALATVEDGQAITVCGAGSGTNATCADGATDLITSVVGRAIGTNTIVLAAPCTTTVASATVIPGVANTGYTYGYEIAAMFGVPNGAITAVSPATTVSQTAQAPFDPTNATWLGTHTAVSWSAVTGANQYVVYKSINNGPYNYYTTTTGVSFNDYGTQAMYGFGAADYGFPATAPAAVTPNDVFAQITSVTANGATVALGAWPTTVLPNGPKYNLVPTGAASTYPSQPLQSATVTVYHDDTAAFQTVYQTLYNQGGGVLVKVPAADYNVSLADVYGGPRAFNIFALTNVTLEGDGWASRIHVFGTHDGDAGGGGFIWSFGGFGSIEPPGSNAQARYAGGADNTGTNTAYTLVDPVQPGQNTVVLATPANASNFSVGKYATIFSSDGTNTYPNRDYATILDKIVSINSTTGLITLADPVVHQYTANQTSPWNFCTHCAGAPMISQLSFGPVADNITFRNFWLEGPVKLFIDDSDANVTLSGLWAHVHGFYGSNLHYKLHVTGNTIYEDGVPSSQPTGFSASNGSREEVVEDNNYTGRGATAFQFCIEWASNIAVDHNIIKLENAYFDSNNIMFANQGCTNGLFTDNRVSITKSNMADVIGWASPGPWMLKLSNNQLYIDKQSRQSVGIGDPILGNTLSDQSRVDISRNHWVFESDQGTGLRTFGVLNGAATEQWCGQGVSVAAAATTDYIGKNQLANTASITTEANAQVPSIGSCFVSDLEITQAAANTNVPTYTINNNTSPQAVTCQVANTATTCKDTTHFFTASSGNKLDVNRLNPASATSTGVVVACFRLNCW